MTRFLLWALFCFLRGAVGFVALQCTLPADRELRGRCAPVFMTGLPRFARNDGPVKEPHRA